MRVHIREIGFDALLTISVATSVMTYLGRLNLSPIIGVGIGIALISFGILVIVPRKERRQAGLLALIYGGLSGIVVPWSVTSITTFPIGNQYTVTLALSGIILLLMFAHLHVTAFRPVDATRQTRHPV